MNSESTPAQAKHEAWRATVFVGGTGWILEIRQLMLSSGRVWEHRQLCFLESGKFRPKAPDQASRRLGAGQNRSLGLFLPPGLCPLPSQCAVALGASLMLKLVSGSYISLLSWPMQAYIGLSVEEVQRLMSCLADQSDKRNLRPLSIPHPSVILQFKELLNIWLGEVLMKEGFKDLLRLSARRHTHLLYFFCMNIR